jgi:uncharacterized protein Smg (DUF494 family)
MWDGSPLALAAFASDKIYEKLKLYDKLAKMEEKEKEVAMPCSNNATMLI